MLRKYFDLLLVVCRRKVFNALLYGYTPVLLIGRDNRDGFAVSALPDPQRRGAAMILRKSVSPAATEWPSAQLRRCASRAWSRRLTMLPMRLTAAMIVFALLTPPAVGLLAARNAEAAVLLAWLD